MGGTGVGKCVSKENPKSDLDLDLGFVNSRNLMSSNKFCRICNLAGSDPNVYLSHEIGDCGRLSRRGLESIKGALVLNGLIDTSDDANEPSFSHQPGWDDLDPDQLQDDEDQD